MVGSRVAASLDSAVLAVRVLLGTATRSSDWELPIRYLETITLSLFVFNLLPIARLDGAQILSLVFDMTSPVSHSSIRDESAAELMEKGEPMGGGPLPGRRALDWRKQAERVIGLGTAGLVLIVCVLSTWREVMR